MQHSLKSMVCMHLLDDLNILYNKKYFFIVKPFMIRGPENKTVVAGESVIFHCKTGGDPIPGEYNFFYI